MNIVGFQHQTGDVHGYYQLQNFHGRFKSLNCMILSESCAAIGRFLNLVLGSVLPSKRDGLLIGLLIGLLPDVG